MPKAVPEQMREINHRGRSHDGPDREADLDSSGLVVFLWLLALLIAEVAFWISLFAHMYGP